MLVLEPAAALPLKAEHVFTAGLLPVWELCAGGNTVYPFNPVQGPHRMRLTKPYAPRPGCLLPACHSQVGLERGQLRKGSPARAVEDKARGLCFVWLSAVQPGLRDLLTSCPSHLSDCRGLCPLPEAPSLLFRTRLLLSVSWVFSRTNHKTQLRNRSKESPAPLLRRHHVFILSCPLLCQPQHRDVLSLWLQNGLHPHKNPKLTEKSHDFTTPTVVLRKNLPIQTWLTLDSQYFYLRFPSAKITGYATTLLFV